MWVFVLFDLPVVTRDERRRATRFRNDLIEDGFGMKQYSVYLRFFDSREKAEASAARIAKLVPEGGEVSVLFVTDKQFGQMLNFYGTVPKPSEKKPDQLALF